MDLVAVYNEFGKETAIIEIFRALPGSWILLAVYMVLIFVFLATTIDSTAYVLASICTKHLKEDEQPARWNRMLWAFILMAFALSLILIGGL